MWHIDFFSGLKYRQHDSNQLGANVGIKTKVKRISYILNSDFLTQSMPQIINIFQMKELK